MKRVKGYFILVIKQFDDTMFGADYHYTPWCIAKDKYCRSHNTEKLRKFSSFAAAKEYICQTEPTNSHDRELEIAYLTTQKVPDNQEDSSTLTSWVQIQCEEDAIAHDHRQKNQHLSQVDVEQVKSQRWNSTCFASVFSTNTLDEETAVNVQTRTAI